MIVGAVEVDLTFDPMSVESGSKQVATLRIPSSPDAPAVALPLLVARGVRPGKTLVVLGGIHGDEYEGMAATRAAFRSIDPAALSGTFLGVPVCNPLAFAAGTRTTPDDGLNLARVFPGRPAGSVTERIAHTLSAAVIRYADFLVDLHSSGTYAAMPLLVGYDQSSDATGEASHEAAVRFGIRTVWGHPAVSPGRSLSDPHARRVPWLYTENPSGGWLHPDVVEVYANGVLNVMRFLGMLSGQAPRGLIERRLLGDGDVDKSLAAPASGFLIPRANLLDRVREGECLGIVEDLTGATVAEIAAPIDGTVVLVRKSAQVNVGDIAFLLTDEEDAVPR